MGLFFEKKVKKKRTKPFLIIKILISIALLFTLVMGIINDNLDFFFLWLCILLGVSAIIDGIESYFQKEDKWFYLFDFGYGVLLIILSIIFFLVFFY